MKALLAILFTVLVLGVSIIYIPQFRSQVNKALSYSDCDTPVTFKLGSLDSKFGLSNAAVTSDLSDAAQIWNKAYGKTLLVNSAPAILTVNFVYDERTALNSQITKTQDQLDQKNATLQQQISAYETDEAALKRKIEEFNAQVSQLNRSGGITQNTYNKLITQQNELASEASLLEARARKLNLDTYNFNSQVLGLNENIDQYNGVISERPEEGLYDPNNKTISIYFASDRTELIHTLIHEFGHALGMSHTQSATSMMYPYVSASLNIEPQDLDQLNYVCREQSRPMLWVQEISTFLHTTLSYL